MRSLWISRRGYLRTDESVGLSQIYMQALQWAFMVQRRLQQGETLKPQQTATSVKAATVIAHKGTQYNRRM
jgi:hypothetical protein